MNAKRICKYAEKSFVSKDYIKCRLDGSLRKNGCPCDKCELSWWQMIKTGIQLVLCLLPLVFSGSKKTKG